MKKLLFTQILIFIAAVSFGQSIQNLSFSPSAPSNSDSIYVSVTAMFSSGPPDHIYHSSSISGQSIRIFQWYCTGAVPGNAYDTDSVNIGKLPSGTYTVAANLFYGLEDSQGVCGNYLQTGYMSSSLSVSLSTNIVEERISKPLVSFANNTLTILNLADSYNFVFYDISGKEIMNRKVSSTENSFSISAGTGMYFYSLIREGKKQFAGKILLN